ncbi:MAG: hypothetical protein AAGJ82_14060 [Bacteroidota bacterium]
MTRYLLLLLLLGGLLPLATAQRPAALLKKGDAALAVQDYYTAIHYFQQVLERKPAPDVHFRLAEAARQFKAFELASEHYDAVLETTAILQFPSAFLGRAQCAIALGKYALADSLAGVFLDTGRGNPFQEAAARQVMAKAQWAVEAPADSTWTTERLGRRINTPYGEFAPYLAGDSLYFTSYRFDKDQDRYDPPRKISKVLFTLGGRRGRPLGRNFNVDTAHTAHTAINRAGDRLYFSRCRFTQGAAIRCELCVRKKDRRKRWERSYQVLPSPVNVAGFRTTQPALRWDSLQQTEYLLFASDRPGGKGDFDLWEVAIPVGDQDWSSPRPLAPLNSAAAEMTPHFATAANALYFSTTQAPGFGGFDLVRAERDEKGNWLSVENLGASINSSYDDNYPFVVDTTTLYFSSNRPGGRYLDAASKSCCPDLFLAKQTLPLPATDTLPVVDTSQYVTSTELSVEPKPLRAYRSLEEFLPLQLYFDNDHPNPRTRQTTTKLSYETTYFDYLAREETYYDQFADEDAAQAAVATFFEEDVAGGFAKLDRFSEILLEQLMADKSVEIFLKGYTSPRARGDYNLLLGKRRVSAVRNHFEAWRNGIFTPYLERGQLVISEVSFGETRAATAAQDEKAGERLSIYSPTAARERRVEIVEVRKE